MPGPTGPTGPIGGDPLAVVAHTGVGYTTASIADSGKLHRCDNTSAFPFVIDDSLSWAVGSQLAILQWNTGQVTVSIINGGSILGTPGLKLRAQGSRADAVLTDAGWSIAGDLVA